MFFVCVYFIFIPLFYTLMNSILNAVLLIVFSFIFVSLLIFLMVFFFIYTLLSNSLFSPLLHAAPTSVPPPTSLQSVDGFSVQVSWSPPTADFRGLIDSYELRAYAGDRPGSPPVTAVYLANGNFSGRKFLLLPSCADRDHG